MYESYYIKNNHNPYPLKERLMALGFITGNYVKIINFSKKKQIIIFEINNTLIALRKKESELIEIEKI